MGYASGESFKNMLQLKRFGLCFEGFLNRKWLYFHIEIMLSAAEMLGSSGHDAIWCVLMYADRNL